MHELKRLLEWAMPKVEKVVCDKLLLHQFLTSLPDAVIRQIRKGNRWGQTLDAAVKCSWLLIALGDYVQMAEVMPEMTNKLEQQNKQVEILTEMVVATQEH